MRMYIAGLHGKRIEIKAESLFAAKQEALRILKPKKSDLGLVWVQLADTEIPTSSI